MKNFWANGNNNSNSGSLFGKRSSMSTPPIGASTPPPKTTSSSRMSGMSQSAPAPAEPTGKISFDHDFACGVMVGAFAIPSMTVTLELVEVTDPISKRVERTENWLRTNDMLAILTREYGKAQQKLVAATGADRDAATRRLTEVRDQVVCVLHSRRAYHRAKDAGIRVLIEA